MAASKAVHFSPLVTQLRLRPHNNILADIFPPGEKEEQVTRVRVLQSELPMKYNVASAEERGFSDVLPPPPDDLPAAPVLLRPPKRRRSGVSSKSFLQWISFGKLGGGGEGKAAAKRSSCPPLGHPLYLQQGQRSEEKQEVIEARPPRPPPRQGSTLQQPHTVPREETEDEFSLQVDRILESIWDTLEDPPPPSPQGNIKRPPSLEEDKTLLPAKCPVIPPSTARKSATVPQVLGKPPRPPPPAPQIQGEREAMLVLAHKLRAFRAELHRSRTRLADSHQHHTLHHFPPSTAIDCPSRLPVARPLSDTPAAAAAEQLLLQHSSTRICGAAAEQLWRQTVNQFYSSPLRRSPRGKSESENDNVGLLLETDLDQAASCSPPRFRKGGSGPPALVYARSFQDLGGAGEPRGGGGVKVRKGRRLNSEAEDKIMATLAPADQDERSRSMEFLTDAEKGEHLRAPENRLQKTQQPHLTTPEGGGMVGGERRLSEHELRIQRSLQKLNVPDWYKNYAPPSQPSSAAGTPSKTRGDFGGSASGLAGGWPGLGSGSKTNSLTSLQSAGRYSGSKTGFGATSSAAAGGGGGGSARGYRGGSATAPGLGRTSRESLMMMSPSSTASASPSPHFEQRSSFTYGMPYALTRFAAARMSCGASPASLSPSPSPVGGGGLSSTSTPCSSGPHGRPYGYQKTPYLGWRSQERLSSKSLYRSPAERLAQDLLAQQQQKLKPVVPEPVQVLPTPQSSVVVTMSTPPGPEEEEAAAAAAAAASRDKSPPKSGLTSATASDLSLNNSEESNSHKLNRVRSSIKEVSNAIVDYVNESRPLDDTLNGRASPRRGFVWLESSFVGTKPLDSPGTPDTPSSFIGRGATAMARGGGGAPVAASHFRFEAHELPTAAGGKARGGEESGGDGSSTTSHYMTRNEQREERSNSSSVSSPTLEDILDSLLALRRPHTKKFRAKEQGGDKGGDSAPSPSPTPPVATGTASSTTYTRYTADSDEISRSSGTAATYGGSGSFTISASPPRVPPPPTTYPQWCSGGSTFNTSTTSEIVSGATTASSFQSDWQERVNQLPHDSTFPITTGSPGSSLHSTPTHRAPIIGGSLSSSCQGSPAKGILHAPSSPKCTELAPLRGTDPTEEDELAFGQLADIPRPTNTGNNNSTSQASGAVAPLQGGVIINPLTGLGEYSNPPTPARHRRVSFDLDFSDKEEKSSSRSRNKDENVGGTIQCRNTKCGRTATGLEARREFKVCHNCNAPYCSRECRRAHWDKHKKTCMQSRVGAICKQIISHVKEDVFVMHTLSTTARRGFLAKGRGCVKLFFNSPDRAERFLTGGLPELPEPLYIPVSDVLPEEMGAPTFAELSDQVKGYNPETRFVCYAAVCVVNEVPTHGAVKWERELISRTTKLRLQLPRHFLEEHQHHHHAPAKAAHHLINAAGATVAGGYDLPPCESSAPATSNGGGGGGHVPLYDTVGGDDTAPPVPPPHQREGGSTEDTLILRSVPPPQSHQLSGPQHKRLREVSFANIQKHLQLRGVDLRRSYPDIFAKLCRYVEQDEPFLPVTIYPRNPETGRQFVCVIMPECSDSRCEHAHPTAASQEATIAAAVASAAAFSTGLAALGAVVNKGRGQGLQRVETINISEAGDDDEDGLPDLT